jgi:hypothetical protein
MKPISDIIVKVPQAYEDKIVCNSGLVLYLDTTIKQVKDTIRYGEVVALPNDCPYDLVVGDKLFFHHGIVGVTVTEQTGEEDSPYIVDKKEGLYRIPIDERWPMCYAKVRDGEFSTLDGVCFVRPIKEPVQESSLFIVREQKDLVNLKSLGMYPLNFLKYYVGEFRLLLQKKK